MRKMRRQALRKVRVRSVAPTPAPGVDVDLAHQNLAAAQGLLDSMGEVPTWATASRNPHLSGCWAPVAGEARLRGLRVRGQVPAQLRGGTYLRNGPNPALPPFRLDEYHCFDGHGMIHAVTFQDQAAEYRRRYVRTSALALELDEGRSLYSGMRNMLPQFPGFFRLLFEKYVASAGRPDTPYWVVQQRNPANNGCTFHAGRILATWEAGSAYHMHLPDLDTGGLCDFNGTLQGTDFISDNVSAHGKVDPETQELITIAYNMIEIPPWIKVITVSAAGAVVRRVKVPLLSSASLLHDFAITRTRVVLNEGPLYLAPAKILAGAPPFDFDFSARCRFGILDRGAETADNIVWIEGEPCFNFHVLNAYDDPTNPDRVILHTFRQDYTLGLGMADTVHEDAREALHGSLLQADTAVLHRWVIDVRARRVVKSVRLHSPGENAVAWLSDFGAVNPRFVGRPHRFGWSLAYETAVQGGASVPRAEIPLFTRVLKHDLREGTVLEYDLRSLELGKLHGSRIERYPEGRFVCNDIILVPEEGEGEEDDACVVLMVHDLQEQTAEMRVLNARTMVLQCAVDIPTRVPLGFHCGYAPAPK